MKKIILDTNFLLIPYQFKVDIFSEIDRICLFDYGLYVLDKSIDELEKITKEQKLKDRTAAKIALMLIKKKNINIIKTGEDNIKSNVDNLILKLVKNKDYILATQDSLLRKKAIKTGAKVVFLRSKKYLVIN